MKDLTATEDSIIRGRFSNLVLAKWTTQNPKEVAVKVSKSYEIFVSFSKIVFLIDCEDTGESNQ